MFESIRTMRARVAPAVVIMTMSGVLGLSGCAGLSSPNDGLLARDMLEMKNKLDKQIEEQNAYQRKMEYSIGKLDENLQGRGEVTKNAIDDMEKRMRELLEEVQKMRTQLEELEFAVSSRGGGAITSPSFGGAASSPTESMPPATGESGALGQAPTPAPTPAPATASAIDQAILSSQNLLNLGRYAEARDGFRQALEQAPTGDKLIEVLYGIGDASFRLKDYPAATESYTQLIRSNPQHARAWNSLERMAEIKLDVGDKAGALKLLQQFDANPSYPNSARIKELRALAEAQ